MKNRETPNFTLTMHITFQIIVRVKLNMKLVWREWSIVSSIVSNNSFNIYMIVFDYLYSHIFSLFKTFKNTSSVLLTTKSK